MVCVILRKVSSPPLLFPPPQFPEIDQSPRRRWFDDRTYRNVTTSVPPCSLAFTLADLDNGIGKEIAKIVFKVFFRGDYMCGLWGSHHCTFSDPGTCVDLKKQLIQHESDDDQAPIVTLLFRHSWWGNTIYFKAFYWSWIWFYHMEDTSEIR